MIIVDVTSGKFYHVGVSIPPIYTTVDTRLISKIFAYYAYISQTLSINT